MGTYWTVEDLIKPPPPLEIELRGRKIRLRYLTHHEWTQLMLPWAGGREPTAEEWVACDEQGVLMACVQEDGTPLFESLEQVRQLRAGDMKAIATALMSNIRPPKVP